MKVWLLHSENPTGTKFSVGSSEIGVSPSFYNFHRQFILFTGFFTSCSGGWLPASIIYPPKAASGKIKKVDPIAMLFPRISHRSNMMSHTYAFEKSS